MKTLCYTFPVSVKGIIYFKHQYLLRKNERAEWELLGGKLEHQEQPEACLKREIKEEADIDIKVSSLIDAWVYYPESDLSVFILTYQCDIKKSTLPVRSLEGNELRWFLSSEIDALLMPKGYKNSIKKHRLFMSQ